MIEHIEFRKIPRFSRDIIITEKIDGTNGLIYIGEDESIYAGSRTRWVTPQDDNYGFASWVELNKKELLTLGKGYHYGEWWGSKIQRGYDLKNERRFSLFNVSKWNYDNIPKCCGIVPILYEGELDTNEIDKTLKLLKVEGSQAKKGYMNPEGIVIFHTASGHLYKKTLGNDGHKSK